MSRQSQINNEWSWYSAYTTSLDGYMAKWLNSLLGNLVIPQPNIISTNRQLEGNLEAIHTFLPWCFALNWHNYAGNMPNFYVDIINIEKNGP